jgi:hypothetical protein
MSISALRASEMPLKVGSVSECHCYKFTNLFSFSIFSGYQVFAWQHRGTILSPKLVSSVIQRSEIPLSRV